MKHRIILVLLIIQCYSVVASAQKANPNPLTVRVRNNDSLILVSVGDTSSTGMKSFWLQNGELATGHLVQWKRDGWWTFFLHDSIKESQSNYDNGIQIEERVFDSHGKLVADYLVPEHIATFPGGDRGWSNFCKNALVQNMDKFQEAGASGTVEFGFMVQKDGSIDHIIILKPSGMLLDKLAVLMMQNSPPWIPATTDSIPVPDFRRERMTFQMPDK